MINTWAEGSQNEGVIAELSNQRLLACYHSENIDGSSFGIGMQILNFSLSKQGTEEVVNDITGSVQVHPHIAVLNDGGFVVCFQSYGLNNYDVYCQLFSSDMKKMYSMMKINEESPVGNNTVVSVVSLKGGGFAVCWIHNRNSIKIKLFDADDTPISTEETVTIYVDSHYSSYPPGIARYENFIVVVWTSTSRDILLQFINETGQTVGNPWIVNTNSNTNSDPSVAIFSDGKIAVVWQALDDGYDIKLQLLNSQGGKIGGEITCNQYRLDHQMNPSVAVVSSKNTIAIVWQSMGQYFADTSSIVARIFSVEKGQFISSEVPIYDNNTSPRQQYYPYLLSLSDGGIALIFTEVFAGSGNNIVGTLFYTSISMLGTDRQVFTEADIPTGISWLSLVEPLYQPTHVAVFFNVTDTYAGNLALNTNNTSNASWESIDSGVWKMNGSIGELNEALNFLCFYPNPKYYKNVTIRVEVEDSIGNNFFAELILFPNVDLTTSNDILTSTSVDESTSRISTDVGTSSISTDVATASITTDSATSSITIDSATSSNTTDSATSSITTGIATSSTDISDDTTDTDARWYKEEWFWAMIGSISGAGTLVFAVIVFFKQEHKTPAKLPESVANEQL